MIRGLKHAATELGLAPTSTTMTKSYSLEHQTSPDEIPMMYRAQVEGRCSLMFAGSNKDLEKWKGEWIDPKPEEPRYQKNEPPLGLDGDVYRIKVKFPFRLLSNCGQDNIIRPIMGKNGIPFFAGSSVKGIFRRACNDAQAQKYCGDAQNLSPSSLGLRFHGAYPIGDWAGTRKVIVTQKDQEPEVRYRMLDVVHPQQERQVGSEKPKGATALASVSLYQPTLIFEFSSPSSDIDWKEVEAIFWRAIIQGFGGKTSTGYGLGGYNDQRPSIIPPSKTYVMLVGQGVSPTLRSDEPEFRPNLFKASVRGHFQRLIAGVVKDRQALDKTVQRLFGSSSSPGIVQLFWEPKQAVTYGKYGSTPTFKAEGKLHINAENKQDVDRIEQVLKFAFIMGGFGKSWRRASHEKFHKAYDKFEIGCHWELAKVDRSWVEINSLDELKSFLENLHQSYLTQFGQGQAKPSEWREAWHPDRLSVFATVTQNSQAIELFHDEIYKRTPAIGGKNPSDTRPKFMSSVWHRMLPIEDGKFLEIVTLFHAQREVWEHQSKGDQLSSFVQSLKDKGFSFVWGKDNPSSTVANSSTPSKPSRLPRR